MVLFIRQLEANHQQMLGTNMPTICPTSIQWLIYFKAVKSFKPDDFTYEIQPLQQDDAPHARRGDQRCSTLEDFISTTKFSLEPITKLWPKERETEDERHEREFKEQQRQNDMNEKKQRIKLALQDLQDAYLYGCYILCHTTLWIKRHIVEMRATVETLTNTSGLDEHLTAKVQNAIQSLFLELGRKTSFLDDWVEEETEIKGSFNLSILDVKLASLVIPIMQLYVNNRHHYISLHLRHSQHIAKKHKASGACTCYKSIVLQGATREAFDHLVGAWTPGKKIIELHVRGKLFTQGV